MASISTDDTQQLAELFHQLATSLGEYRFANWDALTPQQRHELESREWSLLDASSSLTTHALGLAVDDIAPIVGQLRQATTQLTAAVKTVRIVEGALGVAAAAVTLGAAILTGNVQAIGQAAAAAVQEAKKVAAT